ncbi:MAG: hypothetical protein WD069_11975 [Planctomycetales bacterium]
MHHAIEADAQSIQGSPPRLDGCQLQRSTRAKFRRIEVLVGDRVPPKIEILEASQTLGRPRIVSVHGRPEFQAQAVEVGPDVPCVWISRVELSAHDKLGAKRMLERHRLHVAHEVVNRLGMQISTESLELRGEQHCVRMIDLLCRIAPSRRRSADRGMGRFDLVEFSAASVRPKLE